MYCFVYGATCNPISRARRGIQTRSAQPSILQDYRISFGQGGAANILPKRGWTVHGVLLECETFHDVELLKEIGANYQCEKVLVYPYDNEEEPILAHVHVMSKEQQPETDELPQERYVRIIGEGLKYHGVDQEYIDYQIMNVHYTPNPKILLQFPLQQHKKHAAALKEISYTTYISKSHRNLWFLVGQKVIEIQVPHNKRDPFVEWAKQELVGKPDSTWFMLQLMYDPSLPVCQTVADVQEEHIAWAEHQLVEKFQESHVPAVAVAVVEATEPRQRRSIFHSLSRKAFSLSSLK